MDTDSYNKLVGQQIRRLRRSEGLNQQQFAERVGMGQSALSRCERGKKFVTVGLIYDICDQFDVQPSMLLPALGRGELPTRLAIAQQLEKVVGWIQGKDVDWSPAETGRFRLRPARRGEITVEGEGEGGDQSG